MICIDANAHSPAWHSLDLTAEGEMLEAFIMESNLYVVNEAGCPPTYYRPGDESNIDVTLVSESVIRLTDKWQVHEGWTSSDHNAITFDIVSNPQQVVSAERAILEKFITLKANWEKFDQAYLRKIPEAKTCRNANETIQMVKKVRRAMVEACKEAMPRRGKTRSCARW